jgi:type VI secretion system protein ImpG
MHPRLYQFYEDELRHLREVAAEFADEYPKMASRLALERFECADPYVERLLEGFAFLTARVQLKLDAQFPRFTRHLTEAIHPHLLAPVPSMAVIQFQPDTTQGSLATGVLLPRGETAVRSLPSKGLATTCEFRTAHDVTLWPVAIEAAEFLPTAGAVGALGLTVPPNVRSGLRMRLRTTDGSPFSALPLDRLPVFIRGSDAVPYAVHAMLMGATQSVVARPGARPVPWQSTLPAGALRPRGFDDGDALLPASPRTFSGYRLLQEYIAFPQRFFFFELADIGAAVRRCAQPSIEFVFLFDRTDAALATTVGLETFALYCTPAINLFPKRLDRIHLNEQDTEFHVVPDRTRPTDFEIHTVTAVIGHGGGSGQPREFRNFYDFRRADTGHGAYFSVARQPRLLTQRERRNGPRSSYVGGELFVSLVDGDEAPYPHGLRQLEVAALCTNRDLPLFVPIGRLATDFTIEQGAPVEAVRCLAGPTKPRAATVDGPATWQLVSHLSHNALPMADVGPAEGAAAVRELLRLYVDPQEPALRRQVDGILRLSTRPIVRRLPARSPLMHARGLEVTLALDTAAFEGASTFLMGAVLERFLARYVSINSFTETLLLDQNQTQVAKWPARIGQRPTT